MSADPVHQRSGAGVYWTTVNATEAIPGTTTPLTWTFYSDATELGLRATFAEMGVISKREIALPPSTDERFIGIFFAHPAANLNRFRLMADLAPGGSGDALERQFFGTVRTGAEPVDSRRRYPVVAARMPLALARVGRRVREERNRSHAWWRTAVQGDPDEARDRRLFGEGVALYRSVLHWHGAGTMLTQGVYDQLAGACAQAGQEGSEVELVAGLEELEEAALVSDLWELSRGRLDQSTVLERHGFHGPDEGELAARVWRERPRSLEAAVEALSAMDDSLSPSAVREASRAGAERAAAALRRSAGPLGRRRADALRALVRRLMPLREVGRGGLVAALDGSRCAARRLGGRLAAEGDLADPEDVFFMTLAELTAPSPPEGLDRLVSERRGRHERYLETELPDGWWGEPEPLLRSEPPEGRVELDGVAAAAGMVEGIARVVSSPSEREAVEPGDILVCRTTDPGWAPLMHAAAAMVIDIGGPLSHGAIVARELGVPCVIGTANGTEVIRSGDRIAVDGAAGKVRVVERSATPV